MKVVNLLGIFVVMLLVSCNRPYTPGGDTGTTISTELEGMKKFESTAQVAEFLKNASLVTSSGGIFGYSEIRTMSISSPKAAGMPEAAPSAEEATEYSTTNVQVAGVDEADFVKNDNKYIYMITGDKLVIVNAYPPENAQIVSKIKLDGTPRQLFVKDDKLVVFVTKYEKVFSISQYDFIPRERSTQVTHAIVYDISDRRDPKELYDYNINGNYFQSRMIGDYVYFITSEYVYYNYINVPIVKLGSRELLRPSVYYFDFPDTSYNFYTISALKLDGDEDDFNANTFLLGYSTVLYVSKNNIYLAYRKSVPWNYYKVYYKERFFNAVVPILPKSVQKKINSLKEDDSLSDVEKWEKIYKVLDNMYASMEEDEVAELSEKIMQSVEEYERKIQAERAKTVIHKIEISGSDIVHKAIGEVRGYLLNQFSMDEKDEMLRVATTTSYWTRLGGSVVFNNVYVLNDKLELVGKLEGLAENERIYATRFIGNRLYMVTFKRIDPLFVIDLSNPENPKVLGELKITGYSDYLHPYDENHIIGLGKETESNSWGGTSIGPLKLALFDVSEVENPKLVDEYEIGERGTESEALYDHKAFLFDRDKHLLVIPVREVKGSRYYNEKKGYYMRDIWQGAYVFSITSDGFSLKGKISHYEGDDDDSYYWYYRSPYAVRRALYMDDVLYTVSLKIIKANDLTDIDNELSSIELPYSYTKPYPYPLPIREVVI